MSSTLAQNVVSDDKESGNATPVTGINIDEECGGDGGIDEMNYPTGWRLIAIAMSIVSSMFLVLLPLLNAHAIKE